MTLEKTKSALPVIAALLQIATLLVFVLGGMRWIQEVSSAIAIMSESSKELVKEMREMQQWRKEIDQRHAVRDALNELQRQGKLK